MNTTPANHIDQQANILRLRQEAKANGTGSNLHTSASANCQLIIGFLHSRYTVGGNGQNYVRTAEIVAFMNQSTVNVTRLLNGLFSASIIKCKVMPRNGKRGRASFGWSAKP